MSYQAVVRDAGNALVTFTAVGMQISILQTTATGTAVYVETQTPTSNASGLGSLEIGSGTVVSGTFNTIDWANDTYFIKIETDPTGGTTYTITGTSQLMSVPFALHAKTAESVTGNVNYIETDPVFGASLANGITAIDTANWNNHIVNTDTQLDSTGIASLGYVAEAQTVDTDTQLDEAAVDGFVSNNGYSTGAHTVDTDTQIDSTGVANLGFVAGGITIETDPTYTAWDKSTGISITESQMSDLTHTVDTDTQLDSTGVAGLGYVSGAHIDSTAIANMGFVAGSCSGHYVGELYDGGIVFYVYHNGQHGLIASLDDLDGGSGVAWSATQSTRVSGRASSMTDGASNTTAIGAQNATAGYAATLCNSYTGGGFIDWYLPANRELLLLTSQDILIDQTLDNDGNPATNGFTQEVVSSDGRYWSSTGVYNYNAWGHGYSDGNR